MKNKSAALAAAVGVALVGMTGPALADIYWETSEGPMSWTDTVGDAAVFTFDDTGAVFIDGIPAEETSGRMYDANGWVESWSGTFSGMWFDYGASDVQCEQAQTDAYGRSSSSWGMAQIAFSDLRHFTLSIGACDGPVQPVLTGTPGL